MLGAELQTWLSVAVPDQKAKSVFVVDFGAMHSATETTNIPLVQS